MIDIQAGDVVVCVDDSPHRYSRKAPKLRRQAIYRVVGVYCRGHVGLRVAPHGDYGWIADRFRKLDKATEEFTTQIKAVRPIKQREDA